MSFENPILEHLPFWMMKDFHPQNAKHDALLANELNPTSPHWVLDHVQKASY
jgi:hypothetical protein